MKTTLEFKSLWLIALLSFFFQSGSAFAVSMMIEKNVNLRTVNKNRAVLSGNSSGPYVLKAGSVIEVPDAFVVRNSIGDIDISSTLRNWMSEDPNVRIYSIEGKNKKIVGKDKFFKVRVISAAPGSNVPPEGGVIALGFLNRTRALKVVNDTANIPIPMPRPDQGDENSSAPATQPPNPGAEESPDSSNDTDLGKLTTGGGSTVPAPPPPASGASKQEILDPQTDDPRVNDPKWLETPKAPDLPPPPKVEPSTSGSVEPVDPNIPVPMPRPEYNAAEVAQEAIDKIGGTGNQDNVCPGGDCDVSSSGTEDESKLFCERIAKGNFPANLNDLGNTAEGIKSTKASIKMAGLLIRNPKACEGACTFPPATGLGRLFDSRKKILEDFCNKTKNCASECNTSKLIPSTKCSSAIKKLTKECRNQCSPVAKIDMVKRKLGTKAFLSEVTSDVEKYNPDFAKRMKNNGIFNNMAQRLLCLNLRRENVDLDPFARPCTTTAIGVGQVLKGTFYQTLGLTSNSAQKGCLNIPIKDLSKKCKGFASYAFRKEAYWKYVDFTPKELYDMRTLDIELQARSTYAVFLEKLRVGKFNLNTTYKGYFGKSDKNAINRIENCVETGR